MRASSDSPPAVRFCPYCGQPLGSFFGARIEGGGGLVRPLPGMFQGRTR